jgi:diaminopimelate decarboxylase
LLAPSQNGLRCEEVPIVEVVTAVGTPVYVYSQATLLQQADKYRQAAVTAVPRSLICYAVKANGNPSLLRLLAQAGLGADVTSGGELFLALHAGFDPQKILFSGVGKSEAEIEAALAAGIRALHVESAQELDLIAALAARHQIVASVGVRVNPNVSAGTHPHISTGSHGHKFGVTLAQGMAMLHQASAHEWLRPVGLAAHIGSQIADIGPFVESARLLCAAAAEAAAAGIHLEYLDAGGGLAIRYADGDSAPHPAQWLTAVAAPVAAAGYELVVEPGRSIVGPAGTLITRVAYTKEQGDKTFVITDAGMNDLLRPSLYDAYHPIVPVLERAPLRPEAAPGGIEQAVAKGVEILEQGAKIVDVVGPVCETGDYLGRERPLPPLQPGDLLAVLQAGAYGFTMSSNYNGRLRPAEVLVNGNQFQIIRQRQTYRHLLDGCA